VPVMVYVLRFPVHMATATSLFVLMLSSLSGTITHTLAGSLAGNTWLVVSLALGVVVGAQVGAQVSGHMKGAWIVRALALAIGVTGLKFVFFS